MKQSVLIVAFTLLGLAGYSGSAFAQEDYPGGGRYGDKPLSAGPQDRTNRLRNDVDNLNKMFTHVDGEMRAFHADKKVRADYSRLLAQRTSLASDLRQRGATDQYRVSEQVRQMRSGLQRIEEQLHVPKAASYQWH